jgi:hypothetical protein
MGDVYNATAIAKHCSSTNGRLIGNASMPLIFQIPSVRPDVEFVAGILGMAGQLL